MEDKKTPEKIQTLVEKNLQESSPIIKMARKVKLPLRYKIIIPATLTTTIFGAVATLITYMATKNANLLSPTQDIRVVVFILGTAALGTLLAISTISTRYLKPITDLTEAAKDMAEKDIYTQVNLETKDELGEMATSLNELVRKLFDSRKNVEKRVEEQTKELEKQRKKLEKLLKEAENQKEYSERAAEELLKYKLATDNVSELIIITNPQGKVLYANNAIKTMTGFTMEEVIGKKAGGKELWGGQMSNTVYEKLWKTISQDKKTYLGEVENIRKNGERYDSAISISPVLNKEGEIMYFVGVERDITKEKEIDTMKNEFISLASHQLRTPLSAMKWFLEMLLNGDAGKLNEEQIKFVTNIDQSNERMIELVSALLNVSRIESGRIIVEPKPTDIRKLVDEVVSEVQNKVDARKQDLQINISDEIPEINLDPKLIRNVYLNLLTNAIKYTPPEGKITVDITIKDEDMLTVVKDTGYGIPETEHERVFQKFYRGENVVSLVTDGTGLGLYLVKTIIETAGGKVWFESKENEGTTFWFTIPLSGMEAKKGVVTIES